MSGLDLASQIGGSVAALFEATVPINGTAESAPVDYSLTGGSIAGIIIAGLFGLAIIITLIILQLRNKSHDGPKRTTASAPAPVAQNGSYRPEKQSNGNKKSKSDSSDDSEMSSSEKLIKAKAASHAQQMKAGHVEPDSSYDTSSDESTNMVARQPATATKKPAKKTTKQSESNSASDSSSTSSESSAEASSS